MSNFLNSEYLQEVAESIIVKAGKKGANQAAVSLSRSQGVSLNTRMQELEIFEHIQNQGASIQVYLGHQKASVNTSDFSAEALDKALDAAISIARHTAQDPDFYLPDKKNLAFDYPELELDFTYDISQDDLFVKALECEKAALDYSPQIHNSEGAAADNARTTLVYANSHGFTGAFNTSRYSMSASVIAGSDKNMQQNYHYAVARNPEFLAKPEIIGKTAARKTLDKLNPRDLKTGVYPVIFSAEIAGSLFKYFLNTISGSALYKNLSFLPNSIGQRIFPDFVNLIEEPHLKAGLASRAFDAEGVRTKPATWVENGVVQGYVLSSYTGRKLNMPTSGNAGGVHNLIVETSDLSLEDLQSNMGAGLYITGLMGHGVNSVTGDYSQGAYGFWLENGQIQYPVAEITVAGNLKAMYKNILAIAADVDKRHNIQTGSVLIDNMTVSGNK